MRITELKSLTILVTASICFSVLANCGEISAINLPQNSANPQNPWVSAGPIRGMWVSPGDNYVALKYFNKERNFPELWIITTRDWTVTRTNERVDNVCWTNEEERFIFIGGESYKDLKLYAIDPTGDRIETIVKAPSHIFTITWNTTKSTVAYNISILRRKFPFLKDSYQPYHYVYVIPVGKEKSSAKQVLKVKHLGDASGLSSLRSFAFSPDGGKIYFSLRGGDKGIWRVDIDNLRKEKILGGIEGEALFPSPDGQEMAFYDANFHKSDYKSSTQVYPHFTIYLMELQDRQIKKVAEYTGVAAGTYWPKNAKTFWYVTEDSNSVVMHIPGQKQITLFHGATNIGDVPIHSVRILSDGRIMFVKNGDSIWAVNSDGSNSRQLFPPEKRVKRI